MGKNAASCTPCASAKLGVGSASVDSYGRTIVQPNGGSNRAPNDEDHDSQGANVQCPEGDRLFMRMWNVLLGKESPLRTCIDYCLYSMWE